MTLKILDETVPPAEVAPSQSKFKLLTSKGEAVGLAFVTGLSLVLHLYDLKDGKGADETFSYFNSAYPLKQILPHLWPDHSPLFFFVSHFVLKLINYTHDLGLQRLPWAILGVLLIPLLYRLAREIAGSQTVALTVALLGAIQPNLLPLTREFRMYGLLLLFSMLAMLFGLQALRYNKIWAWVAFGVCCELNLYNHYNALLATFGLGLFGAIWLGLNLVAVLDRKQRFPKIPYEFELTLNQTLLRLLALALSSILIFALYLPWFPHFLNLLHASGFGPNIDWNKPANASNFEKYLSSAGFGPGLGVWLTLPLSVLGLGWLLWKRLYYGLFSLCYFWLMFVVLSNLPGHDNLFDISRYYCFVTPVYLVMVGQGLAVCGWALRKTRVSELKFALPTLLVGLLCFQSFQVSLTLETYRPQRIYLNDVADFLNQTLQPADTVLVGATRLDNAIFKRNYFIADNLTYYMTPDQSHEVAVRSHFVEIENLISLPYLQKLQVSQANIWLLGVLDGSEAEKASQSQLFSQNQDRFESHCFEALCFIKVRPAYQASNQYANLQLMFEQFGWLSPDYVTEAALLAHLDLQKLHTLTPLNTAEIDLTSSPTYVTQPATADSANVYYCLKFQYRGNPQRLFVGLQNQAGQNIKIVPDWEGYAPPPTNFEQGQWQEASLIFAAVPGTTRTIFTAIGSQDAAALRNVQLWQIASR